MNRAKNGDGLEMLAAAVIKQTCVDYANLMCKCQGNMKYLKPIERKELKDCESFFMGPDFVFYSKKLDGPALLKKLKEQIVENDYDYDKIREARKTYEKELLEE